MLTYALLTHADVCGRMLTYAMSVDQLLQVKSGDTLAYADAC
jgi:hypothetical protein